MDFCDATLGCDVMQIEIEGEKKHETKAAKLGLKAMSETGERPLEDKVVTFDALNTQKDIIAMIVDGGGGYVAPIKGNHEHMHLDMQAFAAKHVEFKSEHVAFKDCECVHIGSGESEAGESKTDKEDAEKENIEQENVEQENVEQENADNQIPVKVFCITTYEAKGKLRILKHYLLFEREGAEKEIRDLSAWKGCRYLGIERTLKIDWDGSETEVFRYYLTSGLTVEEFKFGCRDHWTVENSVHWTMDKILKDDKGQATISGGANFLRAMRTLASALVNFYVNTHRVLMKSITSTMLINDFHDNLVAVASGGTLECIITEGMSKKLRETYEDNNAHAKLSVNNVLGFFRMP
jgi:predicted transposase YbfD/YdcC